MFATITNLNLGSLQPFPFLLQTELIEVLLPLSSMGALLDVQASAVLLALALLRIILVTPRKGLTATLSVCQ